MFLERAVSFINHLIAGDAWASTRLKPFAGQTACIALGSLTLPLTIDANGRLARGQENAPAEVHIRLPDDAPLRWLSNRQSIFMATRISGPADFAEALAFVFRNLRWDVEADLATIFGDIVASRLMRSAREAGTWQKRQLHNLALNVAEFFTEEQPTVARARDIALFCEEVDLLRDACTHLEQRLRKLASH